MFDPFTYKDVLSIKFSDRPTREIIKEGEKVSVVLFKYSEASMWDIAAIQVLSGVLLVVKAPYNSWWTFWE